MMHVTGAMLAYACQFIHIGETGAGAPGTPRLPPRLASTDPARRIGTGRPAGPASRRLPAMSDADAGDRRPGAMGADARNRRRLSRRPDPASHLASALVVLLLIAAGAAPAAAGPVSAAAAVRGLTGSGAEPPALRRLRPPPVGESLALPSISERAEDEDLGVPNASVSAAGGGAAPRRPAVSPWSMSAAGASSGGISGTGGAGLRRAEDPRPAGLAFAQPRGATPPAWAAFWRSPGASPAVTPGRSLEPLLAALDARPGAASRAGDIRAAGLRVMRRHGDALRAAARETGLSLPFLLAMALTESGGDSRAVSPAGAMGLMQLMPAVLSDQGVTDPFSAGQSAPAGARHFAALLRRFEEDPVAALAAWNAGPEVVARRGGVPDWPETRAFAPRTLTAFAALRTLCAPVPSGPRDACEPVTVFAETR